MESLRELEKKQTVPVNSALSKGMVFRHGELVWIIVILVLLNPVFQKRWSLTRVVSHKSDYCTIFVHLIACTFVLYFIINKIFS